jgi:hypothetical protein
MTSSTFTKHDLSKAAAWAARAAGRNLDVVVLLLMMAAICNIGLSLSDQPIGRDSINAVDESWETDLIFKATQGVWSGREFLFTYGPLWQFLASILPRASGLSTGSVFKLFYLFNYWLSYLLVFLVLRVLLPHAEGWRRAASLMALVIFWTPVDVRVGFAVLCFAVFVRVTDSLSLDRGLPLRCAVVSFLVIVSFLVAMDSGFLSATALAIVLACNLLIKWGSSARAQALRFAAGASAGVLGWAVLVNAWAAEPLNFRFWIWNVQMTSTYRWLMTEAMRPEAARRAAFTLACCGLIFAIAWLTRDSKSESLTMRPLFLLAAAVFASVAVQKGVVRSGWGQVTQSLFPAVALSGVVLVGYRRHGRPYVSQIGILTAVAVTVVFSGPVPLFRLSGAVNRVLWTPPPHPYCPPGMYYFDQVCLLPREYATYVSPARYIRDNSSPTDSIVVYPFQNIVALLARRRLAAGVLQNYAIGGEYLTNLQISTLERERPSLGVYCVDDIVSWPVDGISNFQRTAPVWLYLQRHYAAVAEPAPGVLVLRRDEARAARMRETVHPLWRAGASSSNLMPISPSHWTPRTDFLRVRMRTRYSPLWKIAKPSVVMLSMEFSDGSSKTARLAVEPNRTVDVWIYPWDEMNLRNYFRSDPSVWKPAGRVSPAVRSLGLRAERQDLFSVAPQAIEIESLEGIELALGIADEIK